MTKSSKVLLFTFLLISAVFISKAQNGEVQPTRLQMQVVRVLDTNPTEYIFTIDTLGFKSIDSLKKYLTLLPEGTTLEWAPGCKRSGDEPLLSSEKEMDDFKAFCESKKIKFVLIPSG